MHVLLGMSLRTTNIHTDVVIGHNAANFFIVTNFQPPGTTKRAQYEPLIMNKPFPICLREGIVLFLLIETLRGLGCDSIGLIWHPNHRPKHRPDGFYTGNAPRNSPRHRPCQFKSYWIAPRSLWGKGNRQILYVKSWDLYLGSKPYVKGFGSNEESLNHDLQNWGATAGAESQKH